MSANKPAQLFIVLAAFLWGFMGLASRPLFDAGFSYFQMVASRSVITSVCLFAFLLLTDTSKAKVKVKHIPLFICLGCGLSINSMCYMNTIEMITLSAAAILLYTAPYMVMLMSAVFFKERITPQKVCALLIAFTGCVMTVGVIDSAKISTPGIISGLTAAFFYALYTILSKYALRSYHPYTVTAYTFGVAGAVLIPICGVREMAALICASRNTLAHVLLLGFFITLFPFVFYQKGLEKIEPSRASIIAFFEPLTSSLLGALVFKEMLTPVRILGMALIFLSLIILNTRKAGQA